MKHLNTFLSGAVLCVLTASGVSAMPMGDIDFTSNWVVTIDRLELDFPDATARAAFGKDAMVHVEVKNTVSERFVGKVEAIAVGAVSLEARTGVTARRSFTLSNCPKVLGCGMTASGDVGNALGGGITGKLSTGNPFFLPAASLLFTGKFQTLGSEPFDPSIAKFEIGHSIPKKTEAELLNLTLGELAGETVNLAVPISERVFLPDGQYVFTAEARAISTIGRTIGNVPGGVAVGVPALEAATFIQWIEQLGLTDIFDPSTFVTLSSFAKAEFFDTVEFDLVLDVPEPSTLAIFGLGLAGLGFARRRKTA